MSLPELHLDRGRAESFGSAAEEGDRHRPGFPGFPDALLNDVTQVGCGTRRVARSLAQRGPSVLEVELNRRMAAVARGHGARVAVAPFEEWDQTGPHALTAALEA